jgi:NADH-quinone oxidoreductase subunit L
MSQTYPLHLIPLLPFIGAAIALLFGKKLGKQLIGILSSGVVLLAAAIATMAVYRLGTELPPAGRLVDSFFSAPWIKAGDLEVGASLMLDHLSAVMVLVVTWIGFLIHVYSTAYMEHDEGFTKFFGFLNLFMGSMLILVLGDSLLVTFVGWEGVGLCSYLLIGFWFDKEAYAYAGRKAFVVNRVGDFGFLIAIFLIFGAAGTLSYASLDGGAAQGLAQHHWLGQPIALFAALFILVGATGKSAQIPLYVWLPDAMAGPTPVSALIHAATMVTAGVYVVARLHVVFQIAPVALAVVAVVGALTALFAATIGFAQKDLKKVLAYSTISQLGFMFVGVGSWLQHQINDPHASSNYQAGIFHLVTHAFFKAGLFLGAGSVMHAMGGEGDITRMGGLKKYLPHTRWTFLIYCLAIAGIPPFAGFWSKDAILAGAFAAHWPEQMGAGGLEHFFADHLGHILYGILLLAATCTAFYMFRLYYLVFEGDFRGTDEQLHHVHESPPAMTGVLWALAVGTILVGFLGMPNAFHHGLDLFGAWLEPIVREQPRVEDVKHFVIFAAIATAAALVGIFTARSLYRNGFSEGVKSFVAKFPRLYKLVLNKYKIDELYDFMIVKPIRWIAVVLWRAFDMLIIDGLFVNGVGVVATWIGKLVRYLQNGDPQRYLVGILAGGAVILYMAANWTVQGASDFTPKAEHRTVTVAARGATGQSGQRLQYRVSWDGDEKKLSSPQSTPIFQHTYDSPGKKKILVEAYDPRWGTKSRESHTVNIQ